MKNRAKVQQEHRKVKSKWTQVIPREVQVGYWGKISTLKGLAQAVQGSGEFAIPGRI